MNGKEKCRMLREIRREIAEKNGIPYEVEECTYQGDDCAGTCPKCDAELEWLEAELAKRAEGGAQVDMRSVIAEEEECRRAAAEESGRKTETSFLKRTRLLFQREKTSDARGAKWDPEQEKRREEEERVKWVRKIKTGRLRKRVECRIREIEVNLEHLKEEINKILQTESVGGNRSLIELTAEYRVLQDELSERRGQPHFLHIMEQMIEQGDMEGVERAIKNGDIARIEQTLPSIDDIDDTDDIGDLQGIMVPRFDPEMFRGPIVEMTRQSIEDMEKRRKPPESVLDSEFLPISSIGNADEENETEE